MAVTFEIYGVPRLRTGLAEVVVEAGTLGDALAELDRRFPALGGVLLQGGRLPAHYAVSLNGRTFVSDPASPLAAGDRLVILAADAGG